MNTPLVAILIVICIVTVGVVVFAASNFREQVSSSDFSGTPRFIIIIFLAGIAIGASAWAYSKS
jgi:hypothetical protein